MSTGRSLADTVRQLGQSAQSVAQPSSGDTLEENWKSAESFQTPLSCAGMEGPASVLCLRTCSIKDCKSVCFGGNPSVLGQGRLSRSSHRAMKLRRSNSISTCTLPIIPEYPGFQDIKLSRNYLETPAFSRLFQGLEGGKSSSAQLNAFPSRASLVHCLGGSSRGYLKGHSTTSGAFRDKPLEEYFNERLMELRNYESKRSNRKAKAFSDKSQSTFLSRRLSRRRSSCGSVAVMGHGKESEGACSSATQGNTSVMELSKQEAPQDVLNLYKGGFLDILTMHITAPLEAFVQRK